MTFLVLSLMALYLYLGFNIAWKEHEVYKGLYRDRGNGISIHSHDLEVLKSLDNIGGLSSRGYRINFTVFVIIWLPLILVSCYNVIKSKVSRIKGRFFWWKNIKIGKLDFYISLYKPYSKRYKKIYIKGEQLYIDLYFIGIGVWKEV